MTTQPQPEPVHHLVTVLQHRADDTHAALTRIQNLHTACGHRDNGRSETVQGEK